MAYSSKNTICPQEIFSASGYCKMQTENFVALVHMFFSSPMKAKLCFGVWDKLLYINTGISILEGGAKHAPEGHTNILIYLYVRGIQIY